MVKISFNYRTKKYGKWIASFIELDSYDKDSIYSIIEDHIKSIHPESIKIEITSIRIVSLKSI